MKEEMIKLWKEYHSYLETTDGVKNYYREIKDYENLKDFIQWLEKGYVDI